LIIQGTFQASLEPWLTSLTTVFFIVDPFAATPTFLVMTAGCERALRRRMARRAAAACLVVLTVFAVIGKYVFRLFGITLPAFKFAGGLLLLLVALDMLQARRSRTRETPEDIAACGVEDVGVIPVGIPMLAGPGSISTVMVLIGQARSWRDGLPTFVAVLVTSAVSYFVLASADRVETMLGDTGIRILTRLMGLMLTAIAFQFFVGALVDLRIIAPVALP
jgi:multiple antibiotic resistance protein